MAIPHHIGQTRTRYTESPRYGIPKARRLRRYAEIGAGEERVVYNNRRDEVYAALIGRVYYAKKDGVYGEVRAPDIQYLRGEMASFGRIMRRHRVRVRAYSVDEFLSHYCGPKLRVYRMAFEDLTKSPLNNMDYVIKAFVKDEKMKVGKVPRLIRPMSARANARLGVYVYPAEKAVYACLNSIAASNGGSRLPSVTKGLNAFQLGELCAKKWARFRDPVALVLDCSRFDQHTSKYALRELARQLKSMLYLTRSEESELDRLLRAQEETRIVARTAECKLSCRVEGQLSSGVMNTSVYGVLMMFQMVQSVASRMGIRYEILCAGDDTNIIMERRHVGVFERSIVQQGDRLGYDIRVDERCEDLEKMTFCRMRPVYDGERWRMVRLLNEALNRDTLTTKPIDTVGAFDTQRHSISLCGLALTNGLPMMQDFYLALGRGAEGAKVDNDKSYSGMKVMARGLSPETREISVEARVSFWKAFGVTPDEQYRKERLYQATRPDFNRTPCDSNVYYSPICYHV